AALGKPQSREGNNTGALQRRVNASEAVSWVLAQMQSNALEMVQEVDHMGRPALSTAEDLPTFQRLAAVTGGADRAGRGPLWHATAVQRWDIMEELLCDDRPGEKYKADISEVLRPPCKQKASAEAKASLELMARCTGHNLSSFNGTEDFAQKLSQKLKSR
ncbi:unnamed protein product, partial [Durusdinium trenchii]